MINFTNIKDQEFYYNENKNLSILVKKNKNKIDQISETIKTYFENFASEESFNILFFTSVGFNKKNQEVLINFYFENFSTTSIIYLYTKNDGTFGCKQDFELSFLNNNNTEKIENYSKIFEFFKACIYKVKSNSMFFDLCKNFIEYDNNIENSMKSFEDNKIKYEMSKYKNTLLKLNNLFTRKRIVNIKKYIEEKFKNKESIEFYTLEYTEKGISFKLETPHIIHKNENYNILMKNSCFNNIDDFHNLINEKLLFLDKTLSKKILISLLDETYFNNFSIPNNIFIPYEDINFLFKKTFLNSNIKSF